VTSARPSALAPGMPTVAESGLPGYESATTYAIFAPAKTSAPIINRLNQEIVRALGRSDVKERFLSIGVEGTPGTPEQLAAAMKSDMARLGKLIKDKGIRAE
jgi:tripartite-type tricarboxylate transporter receptor subunit TctC